MIVAGPTAPKPTNNFQNYVLRIIRKDMHTGELLAAQGWKLVNPFKLGFVDPKRTPASSKRIEGAADGGEGSLPF